MKKILKSLFRYLPSFIILNTGLVRFAHHKPIPRGIVSFSIEGEGLRLAADDGYIARQVFWRGISGWEENELRYFTKLCEISSDIVEIGANIGYFTVFGATATRGMKYSVFEPLPYNCSQLRKNLALNDLDWVQVYEAAVVSSDIQGSITFNIPKDEEYGAATGGFVDGANITGREVRAQIEVPVINGPNALASADLIKIDAEGAEYAILSSASGVLAQTRPIILMEVLEETPDLRAWIFNFVKQNEYLILVINEGDGAGVLIDAEDVLSVDLLLLYGTRDLTVCPREKYNEVQSLVNVI